MARCIVCAGVRRSCVPAAWCRPVSSQYAACVLPHVIRRPLFYAVAIQRRAIAQSNTTVPQRAAACAGSLDIDEISKMLYYNYNVVALIVEQLSEGSNISKSAVPYPPVTPALHPPCCLCIWGVRRRVGFRAGGRVF